jgi:hypothetical protein
MLLRRLLALLLLVGLWLTFKGRLEPDFDPFHGSSTVRAASAAHEDKNSSQVPSLPSGDHKDQHGCYHSHAPFALVSALFSCHLTSSVLVTTSLPDPLSIALTNILHPPRA